MPQTKATPAERNAVGRKQIEQAFEQVCPHVLGNPFIPAASWPLPRQALFLGLHQQYPSDRVFQALYGGAAGGGKSQALLMALAQYAWRFGEFAAVAFRRTYTDLTRPGALLDRAMEWWIPAGAHWDGSKGIFTFPSGAKVVMSYLFRPNDHLLHQGAEYHCTVWDELTQWPTSSQYEYVGISRVRRKANSQIPLRTLAASNPGGPGHAWVLRKFIGGADPSTGVYVPPEHPYVPARLQDNPHLDQDTYIRGLSALHPTVRAQLLEGDWRAREPGDYFRAGWFGPLLDPETDKWPSKDALRIRWWDLAASEKTDAARTAGVLMARHRNGVRAVEHARAFRATPGRRDDLIVQQAQADGHGVIVGIEIEAGSGGPAQFLALEKRLRSQGFRVAGARPKAELTTAEGRLLTRQPGSMSGKEARADPVASCLERGAQRRGEVPDSGAPWYGIDRDLPPYAQRDGIRLFSGPWVQEFLDEIEGFPDGACCDLVDAMSGAWAWLEAHPMGSQLPLAQENAAQLSSTAHPEDREQQQTDRRRMWRP